MELCIQMMEDFGLLIPLHNSQPKPTTSSTTTTTSPSIPTEWLAPTFLPDNPPDKVMEIISGEDPLVTHRRVYSFRMSAVVVVCELIGRLRAEDKKAKLVAWKYGMLIQRFVFLSLNFSHTPLSFLVWLLFPHPSLFMSHCALLIPSHFSSSSLSLSHLLSLSSLSFSPSPHSFTGDLLCLSFPLLAPQDHQSTVGWWESTTWFQCM